MTTDVREAQAKDLDQICNLISFLFEQEEEFKPERMLQERGLEMILSNPDIGRILVMERAGKLIGVVNLLLTVSTALGGRVAILEDLVLHPDERGRGLGSQLLEEALAKAKELGCKRVTLLTDADNTKAQSLYRKHGFRLSNMKPMRLHF